jgi:hypothetical protein
LEAARLNCPLLRSLRTKPTHKDIAVPPDLFINKVKDGEIAASLSLVTFLILPCYPVIFFIHLSLPFSTHTQRPPHEDIAHASVIFVPFHVWHLAPHRACSQKMFDQHCIESGTEPGTGNSEEFFCPFQWVSAIASVTSHIVFQSPQLISLTPLPRVISSELH